MERMDENKGKTIILEESMKRQRKNMGKTIIIYFQEK